MAEQSEKEQKGFIEKYVSDPTDLTTKQTLREIAWLEKFFAAEITALKKATEVAHDDLVRVPTDVQKQVGGLKEVMEAEFKLLGQRISDTDNLNEEKFDNIKDQLYAVEQARQEQKKDTATAVDAALKAAKEAVTEQNASNAIAINKSEAATTKQIDQQAELIRQITKAFDEKIADIKERLSKGDGKTMGIQQFIGWIVAALAVAGFIITNVK